MPETIDLTPRITGFGHVLHPVTVNVQIERPDGTTQTVPREAQPGISLRYAFADMAGNVMGDLFANYGEQESAALLAAAGIDAGAVWLAAFDVLKEQVELLKDSTSPGSNTAVRGYLRVDMVQGSFRPYQQMTMTMTIGVYRKPDFSGQPIGGYQIVCGDKSVRDRRTENIDALNRRIDEEIPFARGEHESQQGMTQEELAASIEQHRTVLRQLRAEKDRINSVLFVNLKTALEISEVQAALAAVAQAFFAERIANDSEWSHIDLASLMQGFEKRFGEIIQAG